MATRRRRSPVSRATAKATQNLDELERAYKRNLKQALDAGEDALQAARTATIKTRFTSVVKGMVARGVVEGYAAGTDGGELDPRWVYDRYLNKSWDGTGLTISQRIVKNAQDGTEAVAQALRGAMRDGKAWSSRARIVQATNEIASDPSKVMTDLMRYARRSLSIDDAAEYRRVIGAAQRAVERLKDAPEQTGQLRRAYQGLINATDKGSQAGIERAIERVVRSKMRYNAQRIVRTESARAYGQARVNEMASDSSVAAVKWQLSSAHIVEDICDFHAGADLYGLGAGVYPKDQFPEYPAHPNCMCVLTEVYAVELDNSPKYNEDGGEKWLEDQSEKMQKAVLGVGGRDAWEGGESWQSLARGWNGIEQKQVVRFDD